MKIAEAFVEIRAKLTKFEQDLEEARRTTASKSKSIAGELTKAVSAVAFGAGIKKSIDAASDLNETLSKTKVIFGDNADEVIAFSKTTADSMGLSQRAYLDATSGLKGLLDNMGLTKDESTSWAQQLTSLGADLGSFFNKAPADAILAIQSALRGETEPIRQFNVQVSQAAVEQKALTLGLWDGTGAITANVKAQATLALIMDQTTAAQGDFARTADGAANTQRRSAAKMEDSAASLGQNFLPIYQKIVALVGFLAEGFGHLPAPVQLALVALVGLVALSGPIKSLKETIDAVEVAVKKLGVSGASAGLALGALGLVVIAATGWYQANASAKARLKGVTDEFVTALNAEKDGQKGAVDAAIQKAISDKKLLDSAKLLGLSATDLARLVRGDTVPAYDELIRKQEEAVNGQQDSANQFRTSSTEASKYRGALSTVRQTVDLYATGLENALEVQQTTAGVQGELAAADAETARELSRLTAATDAHVSAAEKDAAIKAEQVQRANDLQAAEAAVERQEKANESATERLASAIEGTSNEFDALVSAADSLQKALEAVFGGSEGLEEANRTLAAAVEETTGSIKENGRTLDINTEKGRANREAIQKQADAALAQGVAMVRSGSSTTEATNKINEHIAALREQLTALGLNTDEVDAYITQLGLTPENITTSVNLANDAQARERLAGIQEQLGTISAGAAAKIQALIDQGQFDKAEAMLLEIARSRNIHVNLVPGSGLRFISDRNQVALRLDGEPTALGGYFRSRPGGYLRRVGEAGDETVLPLSRPQQLRSLLANRAVSGPIEAALGVDSAPTTVSGGDTFQFLGDFNNGLDLDAAMRLIVFHQTARRS